MKNIVLRAIPEKKHNGCMFGGRQVGDIYLQPYIIVAETKKNIATASVTKTMAESLSFSEEDLFRTAIENSMEFYSPKLFSFELFNIKKYGLDEDVKIAPDDIFGVTSDKPHGALGIFIPEVSKRVSQIVSGDYYIAFTSVHEAMIHPCTVVDPADIKSALGETVEMAVQEEDFLSSKVYRYNSEEERIEVVG